MNRSSTDIVATAMKTHFVFACLGQLLEAGFGLPDEDIVIKISMELFPSTHVLYLFF